MQKPKPPQKKLSESTIQKKVIQRYEREGWLVVKIIQCTKNVWPDLQCHRSGITEFVECKTPRGRLSPLQKYRHEQLRSQGFKVNVIYD
jgi:Holliday junction resolvase